MNIEKQVDMIFAITIAMIIITLIALIAGGIYLFPHIANYLNK